MPCVPIYIHEPAVICPYIINPLFSNSRKYSQFAHFGTRFELAMRTRGAHSCVLNTATGLPLCTRSVSSISISFRVFTIASKDSQFLAALPVPPYTMRCAGSFATSGSRLFMSKRRGASVCHDFAFNLVPLGALISLMNGSMQRWVKKFATCGKD